MKLKIILDESKFGAGLNGAWRWSFHEKDWRKKKAKPAERDVDNDDTSLITVTDNKEPILLAVTKRQYKSWSKREIFAIKRPKLKLWYNQVKRIIDFLDRYKHFWIIKLKGYLYIYIFGYYIIASRCGLRIIKPRKSIGLFRSLYNYYIHHRQ